MIEKLIKLILLTGVIAIVVVLMVRLSFKPELGHTAPVTITTYEIATGTFKNEHGIPANRDKVGFPGEDYKSFQKILVASSSAILVGTTSQRFVDSRDVVASSSAMIIVDTSNANTIEALLSLTASSTVTPFNFELASSANGIDFYPTLCNDYYFPKAVQTSASIPVPQVLRAETATGTSPTIVIVPGTTAAFPIAIKCIGVNSAWSRIKITSGTSSPNYPTQGAATSGGAVNAVIQVKSNPGGF